MQTVLVSGVLEFMEKISRDCRQKYADVDQRLQIVGLLDRFDKAFGMAKDARRKNSGRCFSSSSRSIGIEVHNQLERASRGETVAEPHPFTKSICELVRKNNWYVVDSEMPIVDEHSRMFTKADLWLYDAAENAAILVEIKTGRDHGYKARLVSARAHIGIPGKNVFDSEQTRAHTQLAWMYWALKKQFALSRIDSYVIIANATCGAKLEPMLKWAKQHARFIYDKACDARLAELAKHSPDAAAAVTKKRKRSDDDDKACDGRLTELANQQADAATKKHRTSATNSSVLSITAIERHN